MIIYTGPTGSGKTSRLMGKYLAWGANNRTDDCLVLVKSAACVSDWRSKVELQTLGPLNVYTYFGFVQREIATYWPWIEEKLPGDIITVNPIFMNVETAHYLMSKYVERGREGSEVFDYISATPPQIAVQLIDNLNQAAMNCLSFAEMSGRLLKWSEINQEKLLVMNEVIEIMKKFRGFCTNNRILDYSLLVELYNRYLLDNGQYQKQILKRYDLLLVDNLEKTVPAAQKLIVILNRKQKGSYCSFNPEERINRFFGGNPDLARKIFFPGADIKELGQSHTSSREARELAESIYCRVFEGASPQFPDFIKEEIETELRGEMLTKTGQKVIELIEGGVTPGEIAMIAPLIDKVLGFTLENFFEEQGYSLVNLSRSKRLLDIPFAQALITLTLLANPDWSVNITYSALQQTLCLILKLDPIRAALLTEEIFKNALDLPDLDGTGLRARLGFDKAERYDFLKSWLQDKQGLNLELEHFFQQVFGELLAPLSPTEEDILACRQMIESASRFKSVISKFKEFENEALGRQFMDMIYQGTLAADVLFSYPRDEERVILTTPYKFLYTPQIDQVKYLFWLDISSEGWLRSIAKELANPYILSAEWQTDDYWDDETDQSLRRQQLMDYLQSILSKATEGLFLADSYLSSQGWEQEGEMYEWLQQR